MQKTGVLQGRRHPWFPGRLVFQSARGDVARGMETPPRHGAQNAPFWRAESIVGESSAARVAAAETTQRDGGGMFRAAAVRRDEKEFADQSVAGGPETDRVS